MKEEYLERISLRKMVTQDDIASTALFLCTPGGLEYLGAVAQRLWQRQITLNRRDIS